MRLRCFLREVRGTRSLADIALAVDGLGGRINHGELSRIENGYSLPRDSVLDKLELAYGAKIVDWYPPSVLLALEAEDDKLVEVRGRLQTTLLPKES